MKISQDRKLGFDDVQIIPRRSNIKSRSEVKLEKTFYFYHSPRELTCIPIFCSNMASIAGVKMAQELYKHNYLTATHKYLSLLELHQANSPNTFFSIGMREQDFNKLAQYIDTYETYPNICIDVPNGYIDIFIEYCAKVRELSPQSIIMAGNIVTPEAVQELIIHGKVDIVKLGIGPGSFCETSTKTGVGYPQISCSIECSTVAHGLKSGDKRLGLVCLDGGFKNNGDLAKGFSSGADFVMSGKMFAGTEECCGEWTQEELPSITFSNYKPKKYLKHYGMSSHYAQEKHENGQKDYRASEGKYALVEAKGPVKDVIRDINGSLRSTGSYIGANCIKDFNKCGSFIRV